MTDVEDLPESYYSGQEYVEDKKRTSMRFDVQFYSPAEIRPFDFFHKKRRIVGSQRGRYLMVSFIEKLPRSLIDDIAWNRKNALRYVYGYLFTPIHRVNQEMLRQRYALGHSLVSTFSFFDIASISLTNVDEGQTDERISIPWPPVFPPPPHSHFTKQLEVVHSEIFVRDYIDAWNDFFKGDYDNCIRRLITSAENAFSFYKLDEKKRYPWWRFTARLKAHKLSFREVALDLRQKSRFIGHEVVADNLLFLYKVRNRITHGSLRIHQENGWWFCGKALETLQYFYQFIDGRGEDSRGAYIFRTYGFADFLFQQTKGSTVELDEHRGKLMNDPPINKENLIIRTDADMNNFKFNGLRITAQEQARILGNRPRE